MKIAIVNPGTHPELQYAAEGLAEVGNEVSYFTGSSWEKLSYVSRVLRLLRLTRFANATEKRARTPFGCSTITSGFVFEVLFQLARRVAPHWSQRALEKRNGVVVAAASRRLRSGSPPDVLIAQSTVARRLFERSHSSIIRVLNCALPDPEWTRDYMLREMTENPDWSKWAQGGYSARESSYLSQEVKMAHHILVASSFAGSTFDSKICDSRIHVVSLGVDFAFFSEKAVERQILLHRHGSFRILFVGQVNQRKGISYLLDALAGLDFPVHLTVAGPASGDISAMIQQKYHGLKILGPVSAERLRDEYQDADLTVIPSLVEGFLLAALESMAAGTPAVITSHSFGTDIISHGYDGFVVAPRDVQSLRQALYAAARDRDNLARMGSNAQRTASRYDWAMYKRSVSAAVAQMALNDNC